MTRLDAPEPPETPRRETVERVHDTEMVDPYRWLEGDTDEVTAWTDRQNAYADVVLNLPEYEALAAQYEDLVHVTDYGPLRPAGGRYFQRIEAPGEDQAVLYASDAFDDDLRLLVDPNEWSADGTVSVDWYVPSSDGALVAYGVATGGREQYDVRVLDVETGSVVDEVPDVGRGVGTGGLAWHDAGFYYVRTGSADDGGQLEKAVCFHELRTDSATDRVVADDVGKEVWPSLETTDDALVVRYSEGWDRSEVFALRADPTTDDLDLTPVLTDIDAAFEPTLDDGTLFFLTDYEAPYSRLLAVDLEAALAGDLDPAALRVVLPEREAVLRDVVLAGDHLVAHYHRDACSSLAVHDRDGERLGTVDLPAFSSVAGLEGADDRPVAFFTNQSFDRPTGVFRADVLDGSVETLATPDVGPAVDLDVSQERFVSGDGTTVPAFVVRRADREPDGSAPTVLTGYGGFRVNKTPTFDRFALPFVEAGGVFVQATLRGGAEFGESWHEAGRRDRKQNVFDDAIAVAEGLVERGHATPERLGVAGGSNGGLLVGALITQRPDLFRAALCRVPLLDMLRFHEFLLGASWTAEYGDPDDPAAREYLRAYSPYHNADPADYPATLFTTAAGDTRVHPCHARKMTALLQELNAGDHPIVLRVEGQAGHGVGKPTSMIAREQAEQWGFLCHHLGVSP